MAQAERDPQEPMSTDQQEPLPIRHIQTTRIRYRERGNDYRINVTLPIRAAGLGKGATLQFKPYELEELGVIPALGAAAGEDAPKDRNTRTVVGSEDESWLEVPIPHAVIDHLTESLDVDAEEGAEIVDELPLFDVFAGDRMIAIVPAETVEVPVAALPKDSDRVVDESRESIQLEAVQTARPRVKVTNDGQSRMVTLTATRAIREAGLASPDDPRSVSYHPEAAADLGGLIPAVGYERSAGVHDPEYSIYSKTNAAEEGEAFSVGFPAEILDALEISLDELEEMERSERPQITVYAGEGMLGFKTPAVREIPGGNARRSELVDVEGIGEAVAQRLRDRGYSSPEDLEGIAREDLLEIEGVSTGRADRILADLGSRGGA